MRSNKGYKGAKPCPGCQRDVWRRSVDTVCEDCLKNIEAGKKALEALSKGEAQSMRLRRPRYSPAPWLMPKGFGFNRSSYAHTTMAPPLTNNHNGELSPAWLNDEMLAFLDSISIHPKTPTRPGFVCHCNDGYMGSSTEIILDADQGLAWLRFYDALSRYMRALQEQAKQYGENLLFRMVKEEVGFLPLTKKQDQP